MRYCALVLFSDTSAVNPGMFMTRIPLIFNFNGRHAAMFVTRNMKSSIKPSRTKVPMALTFAYKYKSRLLIFGRNQCWGHTDRL